jgi:hypothetical protein
MSFVGMMWYRLSANGNYEPRKRCLWKNGSIFQEFHGFLSKHCSIVNVFRHDFYLGATRFDTFEFPTNSNSNLFFLHRQSSAEFLADDDIVSQYCFGTNKSQHTRR